MALEVVLASTHTCMHINLHTHATTHIHAPIHIYVPAYTYTHTHTENKEPNGGLAVAIPTL